MPRSLSVASRVGYRVGGLTFVGTLLLVLFVLYQAQGNIRTFAWEGTYFSQGIPDGSIGYDGQFFYYIARDGAASLRYLDGSSFRLQRIGYPILARALGLTQADLVPYTLVLINVIAHSVGAGILAYLIAKSGANGYYGLVYSLWIGGLYGVRFNLAEPLCFALALLAVIAYQRQRFVLTVFLLMLATLTKELGLVFAGAIALHALTQQGWRVRACFIAGVPLLAYGLWWAFLAMWLNEMPSRYPAARLSLIPFGGLRAEENLLELMMLLVWLVIPAVGLLGRALWRWWRTRQLSLPIALILTSGGFLAVMPGVSWHDPVAAYRVGMAMMICGMWFVAQDMPRFLWAFALLWGSTFPLFLLMLNHIKA